MSDHMSQGNELFQEGLSMYESYLTGNVSSESELRLMLDGSISFFEKALESGLDPTVEVQCRRALGVALFELNEGLLDFVADSGLGKWEGLDRAVKELEAALETDAREGTRVFADRGPQSVVLPRLDAAWQRQSLYLKNQHGPEEKWAYLQKKLGLLEYLDGVRPPGLCLSIAFHYKDIKDRPHTLEWLRNASEADDYADLDGESIFCEISRDNKRRAKKGLDEMSAPKKNAPAPVEKKRGGGCFVATAAYGSPFAPEVLTFRRFRDESLLTSAAGRVAVRLYYRLSPPLASFISGSPVLRAFVRTILLRPILFLLRSRLAPRR